MYEDHFSQNNRDALSNLLYSNKDTITLNRTTSIKTEVSVDPEWVHKTNEYFNSAEHWLNYQGIETRTEYGNLLTTYNLFLKIGEWLEHRLLEENNE